MHKFLGGWWLMYFGLWSLMLVGILSQEIIKNIRQKGEAMVRRHQLTWFSFSSDIASHWFKDFPDFLCRFWHRTELKWLSKKIHYYTGKYFFFNFDQYQHNLPPIIQHNFTSNCKNKSSDEFCWWISFSSNLKGSVKTQFSNLKVFEQLNLKLDNSNDITVWDLCATTKKKQFTLISILHGVWLFIETLQPA